MEHLEVALGLPGRIDGRRKGVHERMHVGARQVVLLIPAAGSTMSESNVVDVILKSEESSRSSFPSGGSSCQVTSCGRAPSVAITLEWVPSRYLRKYSLPFAEEPKRLERHSVSVRGQFSGASGSSTAILIVPAASALAT